MDVLIPYRKQIDTLDCQIIDLLRKRCDIVDELSQIKKRDHIPAVLQDRVDEVRDNAQAYAQELNLDGEFIARLWAQLIEHACQQEDKYIHD